jgi:N-acetylmuramoyl-L-alanine amidase
MSKKIYINPGHSDKDPGAVGFEIERNLNVKTANYMNEYLLENYDCQTKVNAGSVNNTATVAAEANNWGADLLVSIHNNAGGGDGYEALVYSEKRKALGHIFEKHVKAAGQNSRGVKYRPGLVVLKSSNMPAILNEGAFVDNLKDIQDWNEDHELKKLGAAYAEAAAEYLKLEKKVSAPAKETDSDIYYVQTFAGSKAGAEAEVNKLKAAGFDAIIKKADK